jgi:hypothetical protein
MIKNIRIFNKYMIGSGLLNVFYKLYETHNVKIERIDYRNNINTFTSKLLPIEKLTILSLSFFTGFYIIPLKIIQQIDIMAIKYNNDIPEKYGYNLENKKKLSDFFK